MVLVIPKLRINMKTITFLLATLLSTNAIAASSGTLIVSGSVAVVNNIVITPNTTNNTSLSITGGETAKNVASVSEQSNDPLGYKIFISSVNGGELRNITDPTKKTTYTISYDGAAASAPTTVAVQVKNVTSLTALTTDISAVTINVVALPAALAGTYSDTITLAIVAN